jgi:hypothetical protein
MLNSYTDRRRVCGAHLVLKGNIMRQRALLIPLFALLLSLLVACNSTGLPEPAKPTSTPQPTSTTETRVEPTATAPNVSEAPSSTPEAIAGTPQPSATTAANSADLIQEISQIEKDAASLRGLKPLKDVPDSLLTEDQLRANLTKDMADNYSKKEAKEDVSELWLTRLIDDPTLDLYQLQIDLLTEQVAGYYDPKKDELFVRNDSKELSPLARQTVAHEYTHALQDQHYDLEKLLPDKSTDDDRDLGVRSLVEGDATVSGLVYAQRKMSQQDYQTMLDESKTSPTDVIDKAPRYIKDSLYFPYEQGVQFVIALGILDGYGPINKALQDPPVSSEQIMHPEKYTDNPRDLPKPVALPPLTDTLGTGWTMPLNGTLGEFDLQILLQENNAAAPDTAAAGWGGGVYNYYENGDKALAVFNTVWDTKNDADEFETAINETFATSDKSGSFWTDGKRFFSLKRIGDAIAVGASTDKTALEKAMAALK